jgi:PTH2 family peptidyl-tRNA hydrolase
MELQKSIMPVKQVIITRTDLNLRRGKSISQGAHASIGAVMKWMELIEADGFEGLASAVGYFVPQTAELEEWFTTGCTKISVGIGSEEELVDLYNQGKEITDHCCLVTDEGRTEFHGVPTKTALAIGPVDSEEVDKITGNLKLL